MSEYLSQVAKSAEICLALSLKSAPHCHTVEYFKIINNNNTQFIYFSICCVQALLSVVPVYYVI